MTHDVNEREVAMDVLGQRDRKTGVPVTVAR
jgi:hypothetical protein